jgi:hypothetical protein
MSFRRFVPSILAAAAAVAAARGESVCRHGTTGATRPVSLAAVARAQEEVTRKLSEAFGDVGNLDPAAPFDSGLPACAGRRERRAAVRMPPELVGRTFAFAPEGRFPAADVRVATSCRRLMDAEADALADPELAGRLGVRCTPTWVRVRSEEELELVEDP